MIQLKNLCFSYKKQYVYRDLVVDVASAGIYGLFGRNGSGKSTLLKLLSGLLAPDGGEIQVLGYRPRQRLPDFLSQVYILPEEFHLPDLTPKMLAKSHHHFYPNFDVSLFNRYLETLEVPVTKRFSQMSLGQKKKSAIAFALATRTPILLMDEPTNGLDIVSREQFKDLMSTPEQAERVTLISTHQAHDLERIINHIWFIDEGKLMLSAPISKLNEQLAMGVAESASALPDAVIYQESIGSHLAWVSKNTRGTSDAINIEMLYKALNFNQVAVVEAVGAVE